MTKEAHTVSGESPEDSCVDGIGVGASMCAKDLNLGKVPSGRWRAPKKARYAGLVEALNDLSIELLIFYCCRKEVQWLLSD